MEKNIEIETVQKSDATVKRFFARSKPTIYPSRDLL